jgi:hypothetical protein
VTMFAILALLVALVLVPRVVRSSRGLHYYLRPRTWTGDDGLSLRGYDVFHTDRKTHLYSQDMRPQGKRWLSTFYACKVAGTSHRKKELQRRQFGVGSVVTLVPDPDNPHSKTGKAVQVWDARRKYQVGFIPEEDAPRIFDRLTETDDPVWGFILTEYHKKGKRVGLEVLLVPPGTPLRLPRWIKPPVAWSEARRRSAAASASA